MTFRKDRVEEFRLIFDQAKHKIRAFPGCRHLELHQDYHAEHIFTTYSLWDDDAAIENYRKSALFTEVWENTKALFLEQPIAFSNKLVDGPVEVQPGE